jgi:GTP cyclohydrolase I
MRNAVVSHASIDGQALLPQTSLPAAGGVDAERVANLIGQLLAALGEDPGREGLTDTPVRVAAWWRSFLAPELSPPVTCFTEARLSEQLVVVGGMSVWSLCESALREPLSVMSQCDRVDL